MVIFDDIGTPNSKRVRIFLAEKGIETEFEQVTIMKSQHYESEYREKNPFSQVPLLELDDGRHIAESIAICRYFEALKPEPSLFGAADDAKNLALIEMWQRWAELNFFIPIMHCFRHRHPKMAPYEVPQIEEWAKANYDKSLKHLKILEELLQKRESKFIAGDELSVADITMFIAIWFSQFARIDALNVGENIKEYYEMLLARDAFSANI